MSHSLSPAAIVLFAHGSRDPQWRAPIEAVAARLRTLQPGAVVACAYLELTEPDLPTAVAALAPGLAPGARLRIVPMFLGVGRHAREDLPLLVAALRAAHPALHIELSAAVGELPSVIDALAHAALG